MTTTHNEDLKQQVRAHWEQEPCGSRYEREDLDKLRTEPHFDFSQGKDQKLLEIGVGIGLDFQEWVKSGAIATGIDLTDHAIQRTTERLEKSGASGYTLKRCDAENLPFADNTYDLVYSSGVLHHSPDTIQAFTQVLRVLKPGGRFLGMIYNLHSWVTLMLWIRHALLKGKIFTSPREIVFQHLESIGTKVYTCKETKSFLEEIGYQNIQISTELCAADLLLSQPSERYQSGIYKWIWKCYPRWLVKLLGHRFGLYIFIEAEKSLN